MVKFKHAERRRLEKMLGMDSGYVLNFSNRTFQEFFEDEFHVDIYSDEFSGGGDSKANRLRTYLEKSSTRQACNILRVLWDHKTADERIEFEQKSQLVGMEMMDVEALEMEMLPSALEDNEFENIVLAIERRDESDAVGEIIEIAMKYNFDTVLDEVERARTFVEDDPEDAITAACSLIESVCRSVLVELDLGLPRDLSISPLYKAVREPLGLSPSKGELDTLISADVRMILSGLTNSIGGIGALRTHGGDAHGREKGTKRVDARIARLTVNSACGIAIFLIESWNRKFPDRDLPNADSERKP